MYKLESIKRKQSGILRRLSLFIAVIMLFTGIFPLFNTPLPNITAAAESSETGVNRLQNGSFEEGQTWTGSYQQPDQSEVPSWNTTAFQGKIEMFRKNTGTYIPGVTLAPTDGTYAAELNADEESTLYQNVKTAPSSIYEWGLDHGGRNGTDTMALIIGPQQSVEPSKPSKEGRDQFMQMVDWLIAQGKTSVKTSAGKGEQLTVYSKKFAAKGTFEDNAGNNAFSLTPSTIYTEEWKIWIMASSKATSGTNPWNSYGSNADSSAGSGSGEVDISKDYLYTVPAGQTKTVFGFVSVGYYQSSTSADKAKTYGNFLDNINFQIYHPLSGSTTTHGSAVVGGSNGTTTGSGSTTGHKVTIDNKLATYVEDGKPLQIQAVVQKKDADDGCEFIGVYYTKQDENGNPVTEFLSLTGNVIDDTGSLTEEEKKGKWLKTINDSGDIIYTYSLETMTSATDLHFVFIKSPTVTYDPNGGQPYVVERIYNTDEAKNVYSFKPVIDSEASANTGTLFIDPYVSHAAEGQNDGWKFMGWKLTGDTVDKIPPDNLILPAVHTIACNYSLSGINGDTKAQNFDIYEGSATFTKDITHNKENTEDTGVKWTNNDDTNNPVYSNVHKGITMMAQWRWRQVIIPQIQNGTDYYDSAEGGTVEFTNVTDTSDENYNGAYNQNGGKSYHAETNEQIVIKATTNEGYTFQGWYDEKGNLIATNTEFIYTEEKESVKTYYARFSNSVTQTYIRQIYNGETWENTEEDTIGTLGRYSYTDAVGKPISSTATASTGYKFVGWYYENGTKVADDMLTNEGATISYTTIGNATYYARFSKIITQTYIRQVKTGDTYVDTNDDSVGTLEYQEHTGTALDEVSNTATSGLYYKFVGWYDSGNSRLTDNKKLTTDIKENAVYYARFEKRKATQTFIRQLRNGDKWEDITDDKIATLTNYGVVEEEVGNPIESIATAGKDYGFLGWYDEEGNKVSENMLINGGATISYTTTGNATYYARFEKAYTLNVSKIDGDKSTEEHKIPVPNAEFTLYQKAENGDKTIVYDGENIKCNAVRTVATALNSDNTKAVADFGAVLATDREYYLVETKAPTGYRLLDTPFKITYEQSSGKFRINDIQKEITDNQVNIELANYLTLDIPVSGTLFTGGFYTVAGLSLLALAVIGLFYIKMSRYRNNKS